jgi:hypothetical protein
MTATHRRLRTLVIPTLFALAAAGPTVPGTTATVLTSPGAEFDRITADIRAAVERHDARAAHLFGVQLERLIAQATGR